MSAEVKIVGTNSNYDNLGVTLETFAKAKPNSEEAKSANGAIAQLFNVTVLENAMKGSSLAANIERLKAMRESVQRTRPTVDETLGEARKLDKPLPLASYISLIPLVGAALGRELIIKSAETKEVEGRQRTLQAAEKNLAAQLKELETKQAALAKASAKSDIAMRELTLKPANAPDACSNATLKEQMPEPKMVYINGKRQNNHKELFESLQGLFGIAPNATVLKTRVDVFGNKEGSAPDNFEGDTRDIQLLKSCTTGCFSALVGTLEQHCNKLDFKLKAGSAFFVPAREDKAEEKAREIIISKAEDGTLTLTLKTTVSLVRKSGEEAFATVAAAETTTLRSDLTVVGTSCHFNKVTPNANIQAFDYKRLERVISEKVQINAPSAADTTN